MKTYHQLTEEVRSHEDYNQWQDAASKHPKFARFDTAANTKLKEFGSKKLTIYALDHQSNPIGVYSHAFGKGVLTEEALNEFKSFGGGGGDDEYGYHVTAAENVPNILKDGLHPKLGSAAKAGGNTLPAVHLYKSVDAAYDGAMNHLEDHLPEDAKVSLLKVKIPHDAAHLGETEWDRKIATPIHPKHISVHTEDF